MSFIIKALKKVEEENAARQNAPLPIDSAILTPDRPAAPVRRPSLRWLVIPLVFVAGGGITWFVMHRTSHQSPAGPGREARLTAPAPVVVPPVPSLPATTPPAAAPVASSGPSAPTAPPPAAAGVTSGPAGPVASPTVPAAASKASPPPPSHPQPQLVEAPANLVVNGIAYQDDPSSSSAVVNGIFVKQGMAVAGARIERIYPNKVRFSGNGGAFEVYISR